MGSTIDAICRTVTPRQRGSPAAARPRHAASHRYRHRYRYRDRDRRGKSMISLPLVPYHRRNRRKSIGSLAIQGLGYRSDSFTPPFGVNMQTLPLSPMDAASVAVPGMDPWYADPQDPALSVMTDFREHASVTVADDASIDAALEHMKHAGVRSAFVTDDQSQRVFGLVTAYDIGSEKPMKHMVFQSIPRHEVRVRDIMQPITRWLVVDIEDLERTTVAAVAKMFAESGLTHVPVVETTDGGQQRLRGLLSAARVKRVLSSVDAAASRARPAIRTGKGNR